METAGVADPPSPVEWDVVTAADTADRYAEVLRPSRYVCAEAEVTAAGAVIAAGRTPAEAGFCPGSITVRWRSPSASRWS